MTPLVAGGIWFAIVGLCVGSFLNVCICRLPRHESLVHPPSHCPLCDHRIRAWENVPVLSYVALGGKCRQCKARISVQYPLIEASTAVLFVLLWLRVAGLGLPVVAVAPPLVAASVLLAVSVTDLRHRTVPDALTLPALLIGLLLSLVEEAARAPILAAGRLNPPWPSAAAESATLPPALGGLVHAVLGAVAGAGVLLLLRELGRALWGKAAQSSEEPVRLTVSNRGLAVGDGPYRPLAAILPRGSDAVTIDLEAPPEESTLAEFCGAGDTLCLTRRNARCRGRTVPLERLGEFTVETKRWRLPREVLGLGDVKLATALGAFVGTTGILFSLLIGAVLGTVCGVLLLVLSGGRSGSALPFAPFIAAGGLAWFFAGPELLAWYVRMVAG